MKPRHVPRGWSILPMRFKIRQGDQYWNPHLARWCIAVAIGMKVPASLEVVYIRRNPAK
jgi:hypothetical protein